MRDVQSLETPETAEQIAARKAEFRRSMGMFTTGVCVVSIRNEDGGISAMTVNSFVSVSLNPMLISWNLQNSSSQFDLYSGADQFAVSVLSASQAELAQRYATRGDIQLRSDEFISAANGLPVVDGALAHFECRRWSEFAAGDHTVIFGEVFGMNKGGEHSATGSDDAETPLAFFGGQFCSIDR